MLYDRAACNDEDAIDGRRPCQVASMFLWVLLNWMRLEIGKTQLEKKKKKKKKKKQRKKNTLKKKTKQITKKRR
eukprot:NODE_31913_length_387_cov_1.446154.p2 GENE.NODE_31913_length_387_cov_1.446154~~NODE_31913_length_387_cov_1.446154.p2  ORF type:complete len:74 (+),score=30.66 NODE_31913_length_387_cov_1.446154:101-322(+)